MPTTEETPAEPESVTVDEAFIAAQALHRRGKVADAREVYGRILEVAWEHVDALHYAGVAEFQLGVPAGGEQCGMGRKIHDF